jgi:hypothetical protein
MERFYSKDKEIDLSGSLVSSCDSCLVLGSRARRRLKEQVHFVYVPVNRVLRRRSSGFTREFLRVALPRPSV